MKSVVFSTSGSSTTGYMCTEEDEIRLLPFIRKKGNATWTIDLKVGIKTQKKRNSKSL